MPPEIGKGVKMSQGDYPVIKADVLIIGGGSAGVMAVNREKGGGLDKQWGRSREEIS